MPEPLPVPSLDQLRERRSAKWQAYPSDVLPLWVAELDFDLAPPIAAALAEAVRRSDTGYAYGAAGYGLALADFAARRWNWQLDPATVLPVADVGVAMVELLRAVARPADAMLISPPVYPPFFSWVDEVGGRLVEVPLCRDDGWRLDLPALERAFAAGPAVYLLCNPHNPVGRVHDRAELQALVELAARHRVLIISDEVHAPLVLPGAEFTPLLTVPGAAEVAISVHAASKGFNLAGLKAAATVTGSPAMAELVGRLPADSQWRTGHFGVLASIAAFTEGDAWLDRLLVTLAERSAQLGRLLAERLPDVRWQPPQASYLAWLDCTRLNLADPAARFLEQRVALEPGSRFGAAYTDHVRLNFGTSPEILAEAVERMAAAVG